ncbi:hypothetical protein M7I_4078 [Glarea lozoyensis 74030]|uniref:Rhodopsin domain-containing protein n=1 Tax=Glarea lozoyensis (strain ATCC 74030 / MF5533) TaxID=1104152 RepID=H0EN75_GLAL7|nr:hypothetical protein M7I_4078 [Glarea lozoyensis 74030]
MRICVDRRQKLAIWIIITTTVVFTVFYFFLVVFQCSPVPYFWTQYLGEKGTCVPANWITDSTYAHSAISAVSDWTLGIIPVFFLWNLEMNPRTKISVGIILSLGAIGSTATIVRIPYIKQLAQSDFLWSTTDVAIWSTVEPGIGLTASAMATLRPLFRTFFARSRLFGSTEPLDPSKPSKMNTYPLSPRENRSGYIRSGSAAGMNREAEPDLERALRGGKEVGTVTTVTGDAGNVVEESPKKKGRKLFGSGKGRLDSKSGLGDSSEEFLPVMGVEKERTMWVKKTTEVRRDEIGVGDGDGTRGRQPDKETQ